MTSMEARPPAPSELRALPGAALGMVLRSVGVLVVLSVPVLTGLGAVDRPAPGELPQRSQSSVWKAAYSERYPGCVPSVLWPDDEKPVAVLTRTPSGRVARVALDDQQRAVGVLPVGGRPIGVCR